MTTPPMVVPFQAHIPAKYPNATRNPCIGPSIKCPKMSAKHLPSNPTKTISRNAAPIRSQKLALGNAQASGRLATAPACPPVVWGGIGGTVSAPDGAIGAIGGIALSGGIVWKAAVGVGVGVIPRPPVLGDNGALGPGAGVKAGLDPFAGTSQCNPPKAAITALPNPHTLTTRKVSSPIIGIR